MPESKKKRFDSMRQGKTMWIGMIFFASAWMFVLGVFVGRGTAPVKFDLEALQNELIALKNTVLKEEEKRFERYMEKAKDKTNLGFYEDLKASDREDEIELSPLQEVATPPTEKRSLSAASTGMTDKAAKTTGSGATARKESNLTIQVASYREMSAADEMVKKLKRNGYQAYRVTGKVAGKGVWYRVRIGYYTSKTEAQSDLVRLRKDEYSPFLIKWQ